MPSLVRFQRGLFQCACSWNRPFNSFKKTAEWHFGQAQPLFWCSLRKLKFLFKKVDFRIQRENDIFPVEVKSEANTAGKSLRKFKELFPDKVKLNVQFSLHNLKLDDDVLNIPLFMADQADHLIGLALELRKVQQ